MSLTSSEHARVRRAAMDARNAEAGDWRRAWAWIDATGARVTVQERPEGLLYTVVLKPFHPAWDVSLPSAVAHLDRIIRPFLASGATKGPTDSRSSPTSAARLNRLREALGGD